MGGFSGGGGGEGGVWWRGGGGWEATMSAQISPFHPSDQRRRRAVCPPCRQVGVETDYCCFFNCRWGQGGREGEKERKGVKERREVVFSSKS